MISVYWIRHQDHTDMFSQGYIGISNNVKRRMINHFNQPTNTHMKNAINKYGWKNLVKQVVLVADNDYCLDIEKKLRPVDFIGWNQNAGGGFPPKPKKGMGKGRTLSQATKDKLSEAAKGRKFSMESIEKIRQAALKQWVRQKSTPEGATE
jgi:predicted GIY-YIG superfamily endonuclease